LLRSAILSSFSPYQAHASLVGRRVRERLEASASTSSEEQCHLLVASSIAAFVGRDFHRAFSRSARLRPAMFQAAEELRNRGATNADYLALDRAVALGLACGRAAVGMLAGESDLLHSAIVRFAEIKAAASRSEDADRYWLADRLQRVAQQMETASIARLLERAGLPRRYRDMLARSGFYEFWGHN